jgi:hypothetical protein
MVRVEAGPAEGALLRKIVLVFLVFVVPLLPRRCIATNVSTLGTPINIPPSQYCYVGIVSLSVAVRLEKIHKTVQAKRPSWLLSLLLSLSLCRAGLLLLL